MDKRFSLALAAAMLFAFVYISFTSPPPKKPSARPVGEESVDPARTDEASPAPPAEPVGVVPDVESTATRAERNDSIWVDTDLYRVQLSNRGGVILELFSREYFTTVGVDGDPERMADPTFWLPFQRNMDPDLPGLEFRRNSEAGVPLHTSNWEFERTDVPGGTDIVFRFDDGAGTRYRKLLQFRDGRHDIAVTLTIDADAEGEQRGRSAYLLTAASNMPGEGKAYMQREPSAVVGFEGQSDLSSYEGSSLAKESRKVELESPLAFFGTHTNHFAAVLHPLDDVSRESIQRIICKSVFDSTGFEAMVREQEGRLGASLSSSERTELRENFQNNAAATAVMEVPRDGVVREYRFQYFVGPKDPQLMRDPDYAAFKPLYEADYRRMAWINKSLLWILRQFHSLIGNWGVAIILLTVLVKALLFPMNRLQSRQMEGFQKKMAVLKPRLEELKKKFKNNTQKYHEAQRKMMQENNVRPPVFGCLILFLQFPVFIGLFQILRTSFELRHAPFFGWIQDLSQPDALFHLDLPFLPERFNLLPLLMVAAMVIQSRMMPKPADAQAAQMQKMMMFMPFMFCVFLYNYASGLSLYMLTNALLGMAQSKWLKTHTAT